MPDGDRMPPHYHPTFEHVLVKDGTLLMGMGGRFDTRQTPALAVVIQVNEGIVVL